MSRIGKQPVTLPDGVSASMSGQTIEIKGPKDTKSFTATDDVTIVVADGKITITPRGQSKRARQQWGMTRTVIANMVHGAKDTFRKHLEIREWQIMFGRHCADGPVDPAGGSPGHGIQVAGTRVGRRCLLNLSTLLERLRQCVLQGGMVGVNTCRFPKLFERPCSVGLQGRTSLIEEFLETTSVFLGNGDRKIPADRRQVAFVTGKRANDEGDLPLLTGRNNLPEMSSDVGGRVAPDRRVRGDLVFRRHLFDQRFAITGRRSIRLEKMCKRLGERKASEFMRQMNHDR